jgi:hypothetical protein
MPHIKRQGRCFDHSRVTSVLPLSIIGASRKKLTLSATRLVVNSRDRYQLRAQTNSAGKHRIMEFKQARIGLTAFLFLLAICSLATAQQTKSLLATANGEGKLKIGREEFKIGSVVAKLMEDGKAELTLVSDISIFVSGTWSGDVQKGIDLQITGGTTSGGVEGGGKLLFRDDGKSISSLTLQVVNKTMKRNIQVNFVAK